VNSTSPQLEDVFSREAFDCRFEFRLAGLPPEQLAAAADAALAEVDRVERLLSRRDPRSAVSRLNRDARRRLVRVDPELFQLLVDCGQVGIRTAGHFDLTAPSRRPEDGPADGLGSILLDPVRKLVRFSRPTVQLDFGGIERGYALDRAALVLRERGVHQGLLHAGEDLALALDGGWKVGLGAPGADSAPLAHVPLRRRAMANGRSSAAHPVVRPQSGQAVPDAAACAVIAASAAQAEALSTAFLSMGRRQAGLFCTSGHGAGLQVAWLDQDLSWLRR
jgi:thiamine biosynthesis lipoprotein